MRPMRTALLLLTLAACGATTPTPATDAGTDSAIHPAQNHRVVPAACPTDRPPSQPSGIPGACATDAECTQGKNGRCVSVVVAPPACTYDACVNDADCGGAGVCQCRSAPEGGANLCRQGNCRTDGDCGVTGKGFCSPSAVLVDASCREGIAAGSYGYFCHTPKDACVDDKDCGEQQACVFDVTKSAWACHALLCTL